MKRLVSPILAAFALLTLAACQKDVKLAGTTWNCTKVEYRKGYDDNGNLVVDSSFYATREYQLNFKDGNSGIWKLHQSSNDPTYVYNGFDNVTANFTYTFSGKAGIIEGELFAIPETNAAGQPFAYTFSIVGDGEELLMPMMEQQFIFRKQ